jgi:hypothetical protein
MSRSYTYPPSAFIACSGTALAFYFIKNVRNGHDMITSTNGYLKRLFDGKTLKRGHPRTHTQRQSQLRFRTSRW